MDAWLSALSQSVVGELNKSTKERDELRAALVAVTAERDRLAAALDALTATEPLALTADGAALVCVYCWYSTFPRPGVPHPHSPDCPWARAREARGGGLTGQ